MKRVLGALGVGLLPGLAYADNGTLTVPSIATTDLFSGGTAVLALMGIVAGVCIVIALFRRARS